MPGAAFEDIAGACSGQGAAYNSITSHSGRYYANLTQLHDLTAEEQENPPVEQPWWTLVFELVSFELMTSIIEPRQNDSRKRPRDDGSSTLTGELPYSFLYIENTEASKVAGAFTAKLEDIKEGEWYIVTLNSTDSNAIDSIWDTNTGQAAGAGELSALPLIKMTGSLISNGAQSTLKALFNVAGYFSLGKLKGWLKTPNPVKGIGVMNVGIASCNLIYDQNGDPLVYFDVGLPNGLYANTVPLTTAGGGTPNNPYNPGPDTDNNPIVILSHWHYDHYSMALVSANAATLHALSWLVPPGTTGPSGHALVANLNNRVTWPTLLPGLAAVGIQLYRAQNTANVNDVNNNGIVMVVDVDYGSQQTNHRHALLPGDATYQYFNTGPIPNLQWIVAAHHGSNFGLNQAQIPAPTSAPGKIAYSYGISPALTHPHHLPSILAIPKYQARAWTTEASTAETAPRSGTISRGNIMMCGNIQPNPANPNSPFRNFPKTLI
jgi:hypothetical protein